MTQATIRTSARTELQETTAGFWTDAELNGWANKAYSELIKALRVEAIATNTLVAATESYALPTDFYLARRVEIQTTAGSATNWIEILPYTLDLRRPGDPVNPVTLASTPTGYYIYRNALYFVPLPDAAYASTLYYYKNATPMAADGDIPVYPEGVIATDFDDAIVLYVCARALRKRQDGAYTTYANDFNAILDAFKKEALDRGSYAPLMVHDDWFSESI